MSRNSVKTVRLGTAMCFQERMVGVRQLVRGELPQVYELRYRVIKEELGWLPKDGTGIESDDYDSWCDHFGNIGESGFLAYARVFHSSSPSKYMLFNDFKKILPDDRIDKILSQVDEDISCEVTRLVSSPDLSSADRRLAVFQLYAHMCRWGLSIDMTKWYIVVQERLMFQFREFGFVFEELGRGEFSPGGGVCIAACLDLEASHEQVKKNPPLYEAIFQGLQRI